MTKIANQYRSAEQLVLNRWASKMDKSGRPQAWKVQAVEEDRKNKRFDSSILSVFSKEVEDTVRVIDIAERIVKEICERICKQTNPAISVIGVEIELSDMPIKTGNDGGNTLPLECHKDKLV